MTNQKIYYKKVRDLGGIFSATFGFIKQNFKPLYGSLLFFAGPFLLVAAVISANMFGSGLAVSKILKGGINSIFSEIIISYFITLAVVFVGITVFNVLLNKNLIENEKLQQHESLSLHHSITNFFTDFWRVFGNTLLLILLFVISLVVLIFIIAGIFVLAGSGGSTTSGIILMVILVLALFAFLLIYGPIISFVLLASIFVCQRDRIPIFVAIRKVFYYLKGNFWSAWVVVFVGSLTYLIMGIIVQIPVLIMSLISTFSRIKLNGANSLEDQSTTLTMVIVIAICSLLSYGVRVVFNLIVIYQYTSLEEKKEGLSIIDKINQIK